MTPNRVFIALLALLLFWIVPAGAQQAAQQVDCGNGNWCPSGHSCLIGGQCGRTVSQPADALQTATGFCDPGWSAGRLRPESCVPPGYVECANGNMCPPPNGQCLPNGNCAGGPPSTGPVCGNARCAEGRICSSNGQCLNTTLFQDCGNGSICSLASACGMAGGCVYVAPGRIPQQRW